MTAENQADRPRADSIIRQADPRRVTTLDELIKDSVLAVKDGVRVASAHLDDSSPTVSVNAIENNRDVLDFIMEGNVGDWPGLDMSGSSPAERFDGKVELENLGRMPPEYLDLLRRVLTIQADCEIGGPHLYMEHVLPDLSNGMQLVVQRTGIEEIDHFRKMALLAGQIGQDVSHVLSHGNQARYVEAFRTHITDWTGFAVFGFLVDRVGLYQLDEFLGGSYLPLDRMVETMHDEEIGHIEFGTNETAALALRGGYSKELVQAAVDYWYPRSLDMFGMSTSIRSERFIYWGLKRRTNAQAREEYIAEVNPLIESMGLVVPDPLEGRKYL